MASLHGYALANLLMGHSRMGAGYVRLANGIDDEDGNNDEDDESVIDNDEE